MSKRNWNWICEFCFRTIPDATLPADWKWIWQSAVCPECQVRVEEDGGYNVVAGGAYAPRHRHDPRATT